MPWDVSEKTERLTEWERDDGLATIRRRDRVDGGIVVRLDVLEQAPDGPVYRRETVAADEETATLVDRWRTEFEIGE